MRHKITSALLVLVLLAVIGSALGSGGTDETKAGKASSASTSDSSVPQDSSSPTPSSKPKPKPKPKPKVKTYGDNTYEVGKDIPVGTYRSSETTDLCYWATLKGFSGELDDIVKNGNSSPAIVTLTKTTKGFDTHSCGRWVEVSKTFPASPKTSFKNGAFIVGKHIKPGRYRASGAGGDVCYWARLTNFRGGGIDGIISNGNSPTFVEIKPSDGGFETHGCGTWSRR